MYLSYLMCLTRDLCCFVITNLVFYVGEQLYMKLMVPPVDAFAQVQSPLKREPICASWAAFRMELLKSALRARRNRARLVVSSCLPNFAQYHYGHYAITRLEISWHGSEKENSTVVR